MIARASRLLLVAGLAAACASEKDATAQKSAAQVARAIEVLREADNAAKAAPLASLSQLPCQGPDVCETRDACRSGYALHVEALSLTQAAKQQLTDGKAAEAAKLLGSAEQKLADASAKVTACTDREAALRRRYKL